MCIKYKESAGSRAEPVDALEPVVADVEARGWWYRSSKPQNRSKYIFVKDPDGYDIEILERSTDPTQS